MSRKLMPQDVEFIRMFAEFGYTYAELAKEYKLHPETVSNVVMGKSHKTEGYTGSGPRMRMRKLNDEQVRKIRALAAEGHGEQYITSRIGSVVGRSTVRQVMDGKTYQDVKLWQLSGSSTRSVTAPAPAVIPVRRPGSGSTGFAGARSCASCAVPLPSTSSRK